MVVFGVTVSTMQKSSPGQLNPHGRPVDLTIIGHPWWWEARYPSGVVTASDIHIPVGRRLVVAVRSPDDVIHSFWVPQCDHKIDAVPGQTNYVWLECDKAGVYDGVCAEFCGDGHAWMLVRVVAEPAATFAAWQRHRLRPAPPLKKLRPVPPFSASEVAAGQRLFTSYSCQSCHLIAGAGSTPPVPTSLLIGLHTLCVFLTGAFKFPRELNWASGVVLLLLTLGLTFTGQILRWDAFGVWTIMIISAQMDRVPVIGNWLAHFLVGGQSMNGITLSRFFALHVFVLPGLLLAIVGFHLYMVMHTGISEPPGRGRPVDATYREWYIRMLDRIGVPFWPDAVWRDVVFSTLLMIAIIAFTIWIGAPALAGPPEPAQINVFSQPDWYFLWYFGALAMLPVQLEDWVIIGGSLLFFGLLFVLPALAGKRERSPLRRPWAVGAAGMVVVILVSLTISGQVAGWSPRFYSPPLPDLGHRRAAGLGHLEGCPAVPPERLRILPYHRRSRRAERPRSHRRRQPPHRRSDHDSHPERRREHAGLRRGADAVASEPSGRLPRIAQG